MRFGLSFLLLATCSLGWAQQAAQTPQPAAGQQTALATQMNSAALMQASIDKQRAAIKAQVGTGGPADAFFSTPWISPASITPPVLVPGCVAMQESELKPIVTEAAKAQGMQPELVFAVVKHESAYYPCALSDKGALGLMQLMPEVADQFGVDALDPKQNVSAGTRYLKQLMTRYKGDLKLTLAAYNAGPQRVDAEKKVPDIPETTAYVDAILKDLNTNPPAHK